MLRILMLAMAAWLAAAQAQAAILTLDFSGLVTLQTNPATASPVGSAFSGRLIVDQAVVGQAGNSGPGYQQEIYEGAVKSFTLQFAGFTVSANGGDVVVQDGFAGPYPDFFALVADEGVEPTLAGVGLPIALDLTLLYPDNGALSSTAFPSVFGTAPPSLAQVMFIGDMTSVVRGEVSAVSVSAVPEPVTWVLMTAGFALSGVVLRRRRPALA